MRFSPAVGRRVTTLMALSAAGCANMLDEDRARPGPAAPTTGPVVATSDRDQPQPLPGLAPVPKPFIATGQFEPAAGGPSALLVEHASPDAPVPLSAYGQQPARPVDAFPLGPGLTGSSLRRQFGPPAGVAGIDDSWVVYRLTHGREIWLHFAGGDGPLQAADLVRGAENGYVRDRLYPVR